MRYADIKYPDIANGTGIRISLFLQGCSRHCPGCFNKETWDPNGGKEFTKTERDEIFRLLDYKWVSGISILGGEPLEQEEELCELLKTIKEKFPQKNVWLWTGNTYEEVKDLPIFEFVDTVVDGDFRIAEKDISLKFRGSRNQRIINIR